jgi:hypothetical protein
MLVYQMVEPHFFTSTELFYKKKQKFVTMDPQPKISWIPENRQCHPSINKAQFVCRGAIFLLMIPIS